MSKLIQFQNHLNRLCRINEINQYDRDEQLIVVMQEFKLATGRDKVMQTFFLQYMYM